MQCSGCGAIVALSLASRRGLAGSEAAAPLVRLEVSYQLRNYYLCAVPCSPTSPVLVAMCLPSCLRQAMVHELDGLIDVVEGKITKVEGEIDEVKGQLKLVDQQLEENKRLGTKDERLSTKEAQLRKEKEQLRKEKEDLRAEKQLLLTAKLLPPGVVPLLFVFIVHAQPASLLAASSTLCTRFCLLYLALASRCRIYMLG